jgi:catechol 2,3-dioxygenase-like lactoylglutathione lyase family enzyme
MARIRHIAIMTADTRKLADFYKTAFEMVEVWARPKENGAIYLSDGYINLAILPNTSAEGKNEPEGINHFGFEVDDVDGAAKVVIANGGTQGRTAVPQDGRFAEGYIRDPIGQRVDLSKGGWKTEPTDRRALHVASGRGSN